MRRRGTDSEYTADLSASHPGRRLMMHKTGNSRIPPNSRSTQNILTMLWIAAGVAIFSVLGSIGYFLGTGDFGDLVLDSANSMFGRRVDDVLKADGFKFARSASELSLEASYASNEEGNNFLYSYEDLKVIIRSLLTMRGFMNQGLWSGSPASMHFIGTGSCLVKMKQPALSVARGILHGMYLQRWRENLFDEYEDTCDYRMLLRRVIGSELEGSVWMDTGLFGNGPWSSCVSTYKNIFLENSKGSNDRLATFIEHVTGVVQVSICDELEEVMGGEMFLSGNWKRRGSHFYEELKGLAKTIGALAFLPYINHAREMATFFSSSPEPLTKDLTPKSVSELINTATFSPFASRVDVARYNDMNNILLNDRPILNHYHKARAKKPLLQIINATRVMCDSYVAGELTTDDYLDRFFTLKEELMACEREDERFQVDIPLPDRIPSFAVVEPRWSPLEKKP